MVLSFYTSLRTISSTPSEYWKDSMEALVDAEFDNSPTIKTVLHNGTSVVVRVVGKFNTETLTRNNDDYQKIIFKDYDYTVNIGDLFVFDSLTWICTDISSTTVSKSCSVQLCNNTLSFYSATDSTLTLYSIPCIIGKATIKQEENKFLSLPADENVVTCPNTVDSLKITENTRFILSGDAYSVVGIDKISNLGLLTIRIKDDQITADDNESLGIANYWSNQVTKEVYILNGTSATLLFSNATLQLNIQCKENSVIITNPLGVTYSSSNIEIATVSSTGLVTCKGTGDVIITTTYGTASSSITIHGDISVSDHYNIVITPTDTTLKLGRNMELTAKAMKNGIEDNTRVFVWSISNLDKTSDIYATITPNDDICTVLASSLSVNANKYVVVRVSITSDPNVYIDKTIKLINLF